MVKRNVTNIDHFVIQKRKSPQNLISCPFGSWNSVLALYRTGVFILQLLLWLASFHRRQLNISISVLNKKKNPHPVKSVVKTWFFFCLLLLSLPKCFLSWSCLMLKTFFFFFSSWFLLKRLDSVLCCLLYITSKRQKIKKKKDLTENTWPKLFSCPPAVCFNWRASWFLFYVVSLSIGRRVSSKPSSPRPPTVKKYVVLAVSSILMC